MRRIKLIIGLGLIIALVFGSTWFWQFVTSQEEVLMALSAETGKFLWQTPRHILQNRSLILESKAWMAAPVIKNGQAYMWLAEDQFFWSDSTDPKTWKLLAFDAATGKELWRFEPYNELKPTLDSTSFAVSAVNTLFTLPVIEDDTIFITVQFQADSRYRDYLLFTLVALETYTGRIKWTFDYTNYRDFAYKNKMPLVFFNDSLVVFSSTEEGNLSLQGLSTQTGKLLWNTRLRFSLDDLRKKKINVIGSSFNPIIVGNKKQFFLNAESIIYAIEPRTGEVKFQINQPNSEIRMIESTLYILDPRPRKESGLSPSRTLYAFDAATGNRLWSYTPQKLEGEFGLGRLSLDEDTATVFVDCILCGTEPSVAALDMKTGSARPDSFMRNHRNFAPINAKYMLTWEYERKAKKLMQSYETYSDPDKTWLVIREKETGTERWRMALQSVGRFLSAGEDFVFIKESVPRWRNWLTQVNPDWR
jgi:outer membrane protein assembly factor BamB